MEKSVLEKVMAPQKDVAITCLVPYELWDKFNRGVRTKKTTKSAVLRKAIEDFVK